MNLRAANALATASPNFGFLQPYGDRILQSATAAERYVFEDPVTALMRLRQFGEFLAQEVAAYLGVCVMDSSQMNLLRELQDRRVLTREVADLLHDIRRKGNAAAHDQTGDRREALHQLKMARTLAIWFHRTLGNNPHFKADAFVPPPNPAERDSALDTELERLRDELARTTATATELAATAESESEARQRAEAERQSAYQELEAAMELAQETEEQRAATEVAWRARLAEMQSRAAAAPPADIEAAVSIAQAAGEPDQLDLDESATRKIIDQQLRDAGWDADTEAKSYAAGVRPTKGKNLAIAEWPTDKGPADYVLFAGLTAIAVVEAKRKSKDVPGSIEQSKRYSRGYAIKAEEKLAGGPWGDYRVPFLFATNGRPFLQQLKTKSGVWFLDARRPTNHPVPLDGWYTPEGLSARLAQDHDQAEAALASEPTDYLGLRDYQIEAIKAVETGIADGKTELLLAMATGTGKTRTALGLIYRLVKAKRFRRVLFLVDRTSLGEQAENAFKTVKLENLQSLNEIYDVKGLGDLVPDNDTRLHFATVQGMVKRLLYPSDDDAQVPVDRYDCIIVDESHRGYNLDQEMSDNELAYRSQGDYVSKYRRVIDHFDAVRIGLTATPALHTTEIFGAPVYQYTYRQAVIDGYLVDHEPPIRILTQLSQNGMQWQVGEEVAVYKTKAQQLELFNTPDEINVEVEGFNTQVITENFNRVVCKKLAEEIDPSLPGKTMIFCATDSHADMVVILLKEAFTEVYGPVDDNVVMKITGAADKPLQKIRLYKNEALPKVAVTVDLLTTGIDIPTITNLVFIRRVRSRILYEQMLGRATRLCPDINKEYFRIFDAVDLYSALQDYSTMKPVVTRPKLTFAQLADELIRIDDDAHAETIINDLLVKFHRRKRYLTGAKHDTFTTITGMEPEAFVDALKPENLDAVRALFRDADALPGFLDSLTNPEGPSVLVSTHADQLVGTERGYGTATKPEDYLEGFKEFLQSHGNTIPALLTVTQRPKDLTRADLKKLSLELDQAGYNVSRLRTAWKEMTNEDIAASIIGFIRQQSLGCPLIPHETRVDNAINKLLADHQWSNPQRKWLERIGSQLKQEVIVDKAALDRGQFKAQGGFNRLNKIFDGQLESILDTLHTQLWNDAV